MWNNVFLGKMIINEYELLDLIKVLLVWVYVYFNGKVSRFDYFIFL